MTDDTTTDETDLPDEFNVRGKAAEYHDPDGERELAIVKGSVRETADHVRYLIKREDADHLLDTSRENVEVLG